MEVHQQPALYPGEPKVGQQLSIVNGKKLVHGFQLYDQPTVDDEIGLIGQIELDAIVNYGQHYLALHREAVLRQFVTEEFFVRHLQQPATYRAVDIYGAPDDSPTELVAADIVRRLRPRNIRHDINQHEGRRYKRIKSSPEMSLTQFYLLTPRSSRSSR